jgi:hypothetical protein
MAAMDTDIPDAHNLFDKLNGKLIVIHEPHNPKMPKLAVDLQKVIMLPRIEGMKTCVFTRSYLVLHETFALLGSHANFNPIGAARHEAMSGRNDKDICSSYVRLMGDPLCMDA